MRPRLIACGMVTLLLLLSVITGWSGGQDTKKGDKKEPEKTDITADVREINSDKFAAPPTEFRKGNVTPRQLDAKAVAATADGFKIKLPSGAPVPTPTIYKDKLYASGGFHSKEFYCFDARTGKFVWGVDLDDDGPTSCVVENDVCVFNTESCTIFALDAATGKQLWSYFLGDPLTSTPTIAGGMVFTSYPANGGGVEANNGGPLPGIAGNVGPQQAPKEPKKEPKKEATPAVATKARPAAASHVLACFDLKTGKILWQRWIDSDVMSAPVAVDGELYCTLFAGTVYKFAQDKGTIVSAMKSRATSAPVVVGNDVFLTQRADSDKGEKVSERITGVDRKDAAKTTFNGKKIEASYLDAGVQAQSGLGGAAMKLDAANGFSAGAPAAANPEAAKGNIGQANVSSMQAFQGSRILNFANSNYNCMGDQVVCTDPKTGKEQWSVKLTGDLKKEGGHLAAPPAAAGGQIFLSTLEGNVLQMDPAKGTITKTYKLGVPLRSQPAIVGGRIYVGSVDGQILCVDTGNAEFTGWTTWGANSAHTNVAEKK